MIPAYDDGQARAYLGDCLDVLAQLPDASADALVTDPPAGIEFMGRAWDTFKAAASDVRGSWSGTEAWGDSGGRTPYARRATPRFTGKAGIRSLPARDAFVAFMSAVAGECLRVLKPGAHGLVWAIPRTSHWTAWALEEAGFEVRDVITHHFGHGFPKSLDVAQAIDRQLGAEGVRGEPKSEAHAGWLARGRMNGDGRNEGWVRPSDTDPATVERRARVYVPATEEARRWSGWGTALKPASEHWLLVRRPLEGTVAAGLLEHGVGALNVEGCRVEASDGGVVLDTSRSPEGRNKVYGRGLSEPGKVDYATPPAGRWPANLVLTHAAGCRPAGTRRVRTGIHVGRNLDPEGDKPMQVYGGGWGNVPVDWGYADADGREEMTAWDCEPGCPVAELDRQSGVTTSQGGVRAPARGLFALGGQADVQCGFGDTGGASRFFKTFGGGGCGIASTADGASGRPSGPGASAQGDAATSAPPGASPSCPAASTAGTPSESSAASGSATPLMPNTADASSSVSPPDGERPTDPARTAAPSTPTDITATTASPSRSDGCAEAATSGSTWPSAEAGAAGSPPPRFRYTPKADPVERSAGLPPGYVNRHPTVKSVDLMRWLCRLVTPPGGLVLDPFMGSGSTGVAAKLEGLRFLGVEQDAESVEVAARRLAWAVHEPGLFDGEGAPGEDPQPRSEAEEEVTR